MSPSLHFLVFLKDLHAVMNWSPFWTSHHTSNIDLIGLSIWRLPYQNINFVAGLMSLDMDDLWLFDTRGRELHFCWHFFNKKHSIPESSGFILFPSFESLYFKKTECVHSFKPMVNVDEGQALWKSSEAHAMEEHRLIFSGRTKT